MMLRYAVLSSAFPAKSVFSKTVRTSNEKRHTGEEQARFVFLARLGGRAMAKSTKRKSPKTILKLPDLEQSKTAVLNSLASPSSRRSYDHAIWDFIDWYCSEPRLAFNRTVVTRYRISLEQRRYAPATINLRLAAVRRLAYEASDCGLLSPDLAAGIRRVKGAKRLGVRVGNWLSAEQGKTLLSAPVGLELRNVRNRAVLAMLIGCGLRRAENRDRQD